MNTSFVSAGTRVQVINYGPFRGLKGTIRQVHTIVDDDEDPFCFYLIALDSLQEPLWFERAEVASLEGASDPQIRRGRFEVRHA